MRIPGEEKGDDCWPYLDQSQVWNHSLDLLDDLWLGSSFKGFELHVEDRLFFWFLLELADAYQSLDL